jgi:hypothetical protein
LPKIATRMCSTGEGKHVAVSSTGMFFLFLLPKATTSVWEIQIDAWRKIISFGSEHGSASMYRTRSHPAFSRPQLVGYETIRLPSAASRRCVNFSNSARVFLSMIALTGGTGRSMSAVRPSLPILFYSLLSVLLPAIARAASPRLFDGRFCSWRRRARRGLLDWSLQYPAAGERAFCSSDRTFYFLSGFFGDDALRRVVAEFRISLIE